MMVDFNRTPTINRPRRRALITLASGLIIWVAFYQAGAWGWKNPSSSSDSDFPPEFLVDLQTASEDELRLLPQVGEKTARAWRQSLDVSPLAPPRDAKELEVLPNVGPHRAYKLAPHLVDPDARLTGSLDTSPSAHSQPRLR